MRTPHIIVSPPGFNYGPCLGNCFEPVQVEAFVPQSPIEGLDECVVRRPSRSGEVDANLMMICLKVDHVAGKSAAVVGKQTLRGFMVSNQSIENIDHMFPT